MEKNASECLFIWPRFHVSYDRISNNTPCSSGIYCTTLTLSHNLKSIYNNRNTKKNLGRANIFTGRNRGLTWLALHLVTWAHLPFEEPVSSNMHENCGDLVNDGSDLMRWGHCKSNVVVCFRPLSGSGVQLVFQPRGHNGNLGLMRVGSRLESHTKKCKGTFVRVITYTPITSCFPAPSNWYTRSLELLLQHVDWFPGLHLVTC